VALTPLVTSMLVPLIQPGANIASMGYPDIVAPLDMLEKLLGVRFGALKYRPDSAQICKWHSLPFHEIPDAESFFDVLGATLDVYDIVKARGGEILCDLNKPIEKKQEYDFVLDVGTLEHCFNIGQAAVNMAGLLKAGGVIFHGNPHNSGNHGFYGINPTWYADFYGQDGFTLLYCKLMQRGAELQIDVPLTSRFSCSAGEVNIFASARRDEVRPIHWPMQTKYKTMIGAHG
jgi:hypothetical protein